MKAVEFSGIQRLSPFQALSDLTHGASTSTLATRSAIAAKSSVIAANWRIRAAICPAIAPICCDLPANLLMIRRLWLRSRSRSTTATVFPQYRPDTRFSEGALAPASPKSAAETLGMPNLELTTNHSKGCKSLDRLAICNLSTSVQHGHFANLANPSRAECFRRCGRVP